MAIFPLLHCKLLELFGTEQHYISMSKKHGSDISLRENHWFTKYFYTNNKWLTSYMTISQQLNIQSIMTFTVKTFWNTRQDT